MKPSKIKVQKCSSILFVIHTFVVQLQRNGHANISCILSSGQSNTHIGQEVLMKRMTQNDSHWLVGLQIG